MIDASHAEQINKRKALINRLSKPPSHTSSTLSTTSGTAMPRLKLAKLTDKEKKLLAEHQGCMCCCTFYCDHPGTPDACLMKTANSWPDPKTTKMLTLAMALTAKPKNIAGLAYVEPTDEEEVRDEDTDKSYMYAITSPLSDPLLSVLHMTATVEKGAWKSQVFKARINAGLPVPLLLGIPFLSAKKLVLDVEANTVIDKRMGFNIVNPTSAQVSQRTSPHHPQTGHPKPWGSTGNTTCATPPHRKDYAMPSQIMALVREHIEALSLEEILSKKDEEAKQRYADCVLMELPKTTDDVPDHIYHQIRLKNPTHVVNS
ncbi:hypothetical protein C0995_001827 [Termitomyces sp. Mi166|nr:hypothetical protein C0995_001827 [Termitomyces sp. Mi166\